MSMNAKVAIKRQIDDPKLRQWALQWFHGGACCPTCGYAEIERAETDSDDSSTIETWRCREPNCTGPYWRVELKESALVVEMDNDAGRIDPEHWIERSELEPSGKQLDPQELAAVLAGLRAWQRLCAGSRMPQEWDIATNGGTVEPLNLAEIDALCERLNT